MIGWRNDVSETEQTSASGSMLAPIRSVATCCCMLLAGFGTSSDLGPVAEASSPSPTTGFRTSAGSPVVSLESQGHAIGKLRRLSGLKWDELARIFDVSRRTLHFWASGRGLTSENEEHLQRTLSVVLRTDRGTAAANRAALMSVHDSGVIPFDLLVRKEYGDVLELIGETRNIRVKPPRISDKASAARTPRSPGSLIGEFEEPVLNLRGPKRRVKNVRKRSEPGNLS